MWKCDLLKPSINDYISSEFINDIIIIDNNPNNKFDFPKSDKIKYLCKGHNIFVNPAWNWGVLESKNENLIIANDDIYIQNLDDILKKVLELDYKILGLDYENINKKNEISIVKSEGHMKRGFGCFFFIKKKNYIQIPEELKIFYGDIILYNSLKSRHKFSSMGISIELSKTIKSTNGSIEIIENSDKPLFRDKFSKIYPLL